MQPYPSENELERKADLAIHALGVTSVAVGTVALMVFSGIYLDPVFTMACGVYGASLLFSFGSSAGYHLVPWHSWRPLWRRLDHAAIYALIAGTFTPLLVLVGTTTGYLVLAAVWALALPAMVFKMRAKEIEPRWSLASYLGLGWLGALALPDFSMKLPMVAVITIIAGGLIYTSGTFFYARKHQAYRYAIWHSFVLCGSASFFVAICVAGFSA